MKDEEAKEDGEDDGEEGGGDGKRMRRRMEETENDEEKDGGGHGVGVEHPYPRTMKYRGGGYDILRTLWDAEKSLNYRGHMTIDQTCRRGSSTARSGMQRSRSTTEDT